MENIDQLISGFHHDKIREIGGKAPRQYISKTKVIRFYLPCVDF
jgi:hypothetical protein